ncbi:ubiquinone biosynthesis monooxygenase Coq7 [Cichlidogyrus casuarinus]|uniref:5-demethoxyubiquinone hydroxylase, mitochondrial n=1 Tax=Cichlidogyrus casuarinus TaxID=1844966 RepID=A0ABD2PWS6_9PLAT
MTSRFSPRVKKMLDRMIRINHAGEYGANRIYEGQLAVLGNTQSGPLIQHMLEQEQVHLKKFEELMPQYRVRPTVLLPFWHLAGFALGAGTALIGKEAAMACTVAVESVISDHYNDQIRELMEEDPEAFKELMDTIKKFRDEELEHHDAGLENNAEQVSPYQRLVLFFLGSSLQSSVFNHQNRL